MIVLTLPSPPSANRYWRHAVVRGQLRTYLSDEAKSYKVEVLSKAHQAGIRKPMASRIELHVQLFPQRPKDWARRARLDPLTWDDSVQCIDLGNCEKVLSDALNGIAWIDDKQHRRIVLERMEPDGDARVVVTIAAAAEQVPALLAGDPGRAGT